MLHFERLNDPSILLVTASGPLEQADFAKFAEQIEAKGSPSENPPTRLMIRADRSLAGTISKPLWHI